MSGDGNGPHTSAHPDGTPLPDPGAWRIYRGTGRPRADADPPPPALHEVLPPPPPWRDFDGGPVDTSPVPDDAREFRRRLGVGPIPGTASEHELDMVNAALFLRRPLIVAGPPGIGKSSLAHAVSRELGLGRVLTWSITSRTTLKDGLYSYDAIGRVQEAAAVGALRGAGAGLPGAEAGSTAPSEAAAGSGDEAEAAGAGADGGPAGLGRLGEYVQLGPLGTALLPRRVPRVLLIDEFDKSDVDLASDLLGVFEEGEYRIPELARVRSRLPDVRVHTDDPDGTALIHHGRVRCAAFPFVVITSNGERTLPPAFLRRCLYLEMPAPGPEQLAALLAAQFGTQDGAGPAGGTDGALGAAADGVSEGSAGSAADGASEGDGASEADGRAEMIHQFLARARAGGTLAADQLMNSEYLRTLPTGPDQAAWNRLVQSLWRRLDEGP